MSEKNYLKENIKYLREEKMMTQPELAKAVGCSRDNVASYERGTEPKLSTLQSLVNYFHVSIDDIINKDLKNQNPDTDTSAPDLPHKEPDPDLPVAVRQHSPDAPGIPLIPIEAMAGFGTGDAQVMEYECERYIIPAFREAEFLIQVKGSSMYPKYSSGDIVACKKLPLDTFFQWNKVYVVDTEQGALIKRIKKSNQEGAILLVSENISYEPFDLPISQINSLAIVIGVIRLE